jgi:hypothetical protein
MSVSALSRLLLAYLVVLVLACAAVHAHASLHEVPASERRVVVSRWLHGQLLDRTVTSPGEKPPSAPGADGVTVVHEIAVGEGPLSLDPRTFSYMLVAGRDGLVAEMRGKTAWVTVDDLLAAQAYDHAVSFLDPSLGFGTHRATVISALAAKLGVTVHEVENEAQVRRVRFERHVVDEVPAPRITADSLDRDREAVMTAVHDAAAYLARGVDADGRFRYLVDAVHDRAVGQGGYSWPRHGGATYFLAQAAALFDDAEIRYACLRSAARLRDDMMRSCGTNRCISDGSDANVGSAALALIAFSEIVRTGADASYRRPAIELARFLRSQQRPDGELMHDFDLATGKPVDVQYMYFTGEASLALARAHRITGDPEDLRAASRALARLSGRGWSFFGSRYYFNEEHWTCQAMADLWERAPDPEALAFCLRWHEYQQRLQHEDGDSPFDAAGSFGFGPFVTPRVTPASSRGEAAAAALEVLQKDPSAGAAGAEEHARKVALLDRELRGALAFVARSQLRPGPRHLFADPEAVRGAFPGSAIDLQLRIDYVQHAGSMMIRWLALTDRARP